MTKDIEDMPPEEQQRIRDMINKPLPPEEQKAHRDAMQSALKAELDAAAKAEAIRSALSGIVDHWYEFGEMMINNQDDYGFEERIDAAAKLIGR